jgi:hypothetical protein
MRRNCGADPLVRGRPPGRLARSPIKLISLAKNGSRGTRADQGVRPTILPIETGVPA